MSHRLEQSALDQLFGEARTRKTWTQRAVTEAQLREIYELCRLGPTSANSYPARFVWVRSPEGKSRLAALASGSNQQAILTAPVTVIVGHDLAFADALPKLFPARAAALQEYFRDPKLVAETAFRNGSLQGAYLIIAARALGLDCGPMSGFDNAAVDREFFAGTRIQSNFICSLGYGSEEGVYPRNPRLCFEDAGWFI